MIETRNRLEVRRVKHEPKILYRLRQRTTAIIPIENSMVTAFSVFNELFYNLSTHRFTQDRICPCQWTFAISEGVELDLFFLIRLFETDTGWKKSAVLGTQLNF